MSATPADLWAEGKASKARRYASELATILAASRDVITPGVPVAAHIGVACNGGRNENTTGWVTCSPAEVAAAERDGRTPLGRALDRYARTGLHELGPFGVEAGHAPGPVAPDDSPWCRGARADGVEKVLGRRGVTEPGAWRGAVDDQVAIGVWNNARHGRGVRERLRPSLRWAADGDGGPKVWDLFALAASVMGWSAGDGGAAAHLNRYARELAAVPQAERWGAFLRCASTYDGPGAKHERPPYSALRTVQKLAAGALAAEHTGEGRDALAWLDDGLGEGRPAVLAALVASAIDD